ncbi:MAG: gluconate 2-dehydrogenase subunit 3 family protein [Acidobacteria bacterium]|nr:gluconate 2-dehydrogenase subunit 3 family protein [Acidobacteriota bacterium]
MERQEFRSRYSGYDVLEKWSSPDWDDQTREVVRQRLEDVPPIRFFTEQEVRTLTAVAERILPQTDRSETEKVPIVPWIDEKLYEDKRNGYRYEELPPQRQAGAGDWPELMKHRGRSLRVELFAILMRNPRM